MHNKFRSRLTLGLFATALIISLAVAGCGKKAQPNPPTGQAPTTPTPGPTPTPAVSAAVTDGGKVYYSYACVYCHAAGGKGGVPNPNNQGGDATIPPLSGSDFQSEYGSDQVVASMIKAGSILSDGKAVSMPAWNGIINDQQMSNLIAYIRAGLPEAGNQLLPATNGQEIYAAYACDKCHGQIGKGGIPNVAATQDKTIPAIGTTGFHGEFNTKDKITKVITDGSIIEKGKPGVVFMPRWGGILKPEQITTETDWLFNYK
ncbi:MAG: c-type cytochrome [Symbiobacteriia bacterium]